MSTTQDDITRSDTITLQDISNALHATRTNNHGTRSNTSTSGGAIGSNNPDVEQATGSNIVIDDDTTRGNNGVLVENPFAAEFDEDEKLDYLGPELAKMNRILAREITQSLSNALIPLQHEINELKTLKSVTPPSSVMQDIVEENDRLKTKLDVTVPLGLWMFERPGELRLNHS